MTHWGVPKIFLKARAKSKKCFFASVIAISINPFSVAKFFRNLFNMDVANSLFCEIQLDTN